MDQNKPFVFARFDNVSNEDNCNENIHIESACGSNAGRQAFDNPIYSEGK